jgi:hypothetical protein
VPKIVCRSSKLASLAGTIEIAGSPAVIAHDYRRRRKERCRADAMVRIVDLPARDAAARRGAVAAVVAVVFALTADHAARSRPSSAISRRAAT